MRSSTSATKPKKQLHIALFPWLAFEATTDVPYAVIPYLKIAYDGLEQGISEFLPAHTPDWTIHDFAPYWLPPIATKLGISTAHFSIFNSSSLLFLWVNISGSNV
ncbi:hypothetical protein M0R45_004883 [Rubus argutus]|uniref:UDP-rhamnose:rhamnosyltransferase 1 n=1 Tax=Rubus argutus TaxID=59490 RepID=A0AAW1YL11_RUBAR